MADKDTSSLSLVDPNDKLERANEVKDEGKPNPNPTPTPTSNPTPTPTPKP